MKNKSFYIVFLIGVISYFSTTSCNHDQFTQQLVIVDSLSQKTSAYLAELHALDSSNVMELAPLVSSDLEWTKDSLTSEDIKNSSLFLQKLKSAKKLMENFPKDYTNLKRELEKCDKQLINLKADLTNDAVSKEEAIRYVSDESNALLIIEDHFNSVKGRINSLKDYRQLRDTFYLEAHARRNASSN